MIIYTNENIFLSPAQTIVNTVNTYGVMGKGIAKEFKRYYPNMYLEYKELCNQDLLTVGKLWLVTNNRKQMSDSHEKWVLNFPTKKHWRSKSRMEYIELGLKKFLELYSQKGIKSISFPQLGSGNGGLDWQEVNKLMVYYLSNLPIPIYIHKYFENDYYMYSSKKNILENLNRTHGSWRNNNFLEIMKKNGLEDIINNINIDGMYIPENLEQLFFYKDKIEELFECIEFNIYLEDNVYPTVRIIDMNKIVKEQMTLDLNFE